MLTVFVITTRTHARANVDIMYISVSLTRLNALCMVRQDRAKLALFPPKRGKYEGGGGLH
jgi:hypothetical protein